MKCRQNLAVRNYNSEAIRRQTEIEDSLDTEMTIAQLPKDLRQIASSLSQGFNDSEIAQALGMSRDQILRRRRSLRAIYTLKLGGKALCTTT